MSVTFVLRLPRFRSVQRGTQLDTCFGMPLFGDTKVSQITLHHVFVFVPGLPEGS